MTRHCYSKGTSHWRPTWELVINNLDKCIQANRFRDLGRGGYVALEVFDDGYSNAKTLARDLGEHVTLHTYVSLSPSSMTSGPHMDEESVHCLQAQGLTQFYVWEDEQQFEYVLEPGDLLHIPSGVPHEAIPLTPRVLLSYGDESKLMPRKTMELHHGA